MKKVFFVCMTVGLLATSCDWFKKSEPTEPPIVETPSDDSTTVTTIDSTAQKNDSTIAVVETKKETKKEVK